MQSDRKKIGLTLIIIGLVIIGLIIYFGFIRETEEEPAIIPSVDTPAGQLPGGFETGTTTPSDHPAASQEYDISKEAPREFAAVDLAKRAENYAARLGSYSSQSDYSNFTDLKMYMTEPMRTWVDQQIEELQAKNRNQGYYGIVTNALTADVKSFDDDAGTAEVQIVTQRRESTEAIGGGESFRQSITLRFVKIGGEWLIDGAYWE